MLFGASAGALHGVALLSGISLGTYVRGPPPGLRRVELGWDTDTARFVLGWGGAHPQTDATSAGPLARRGVGGSLWPAREGGAPGLGSSGRGNPKRICPTVAPGLTGSPSPRN